MADDAPPPDQPPPIVIIGGGPAGSTAGHLLAKAGHRVMLFERARFPRFHIGESMLPHTQDYLDRLGLADVVEKSAFRVVKKGGEGRLSKRPDKKEFWTTRMNFWNVPKSARHDERWWAYQVDRSKFDAALLHHAQAAGVEVHQPAKVTAVEVGSAPKVSWTDQDGVGHETPARFVIDASGRHALLARRLGYFRDEDRRGHEPVFGHFDDVKWPEGDAAGLINIYFIEDGWVWFIPLPNGRTSFGIVQNESVTKDWPRAPQDVFKQIVGRYACLRDRFQGARQVGPIRILRKLPYYSTEVAGEGWALCGDAALFVDPIHSSGLHLSFFSATKLADAVCAHLDGDANALRDYSAAVKHHHKVVRRNVGYYYKCVRYYWLMVSFVLMCGDWNNPWLRRVNAWGFGHYGRFPIAMRVWWALAQLGVWGFGALHALTGMKRWGKHGMAAEVVDFDLPKTSDDEAAKPPTLEQDEDRAHRIEPVDAPA